MSGLSRALVPAQESKRWSFGWLLLLPVTPKSLFLALKDKKNWRRKYGPPQYILDACVFLFPTINFALIDSDCVPVTLFEIRELWLASTDPTLPATPSKVAKSKLPSPIASSHKRARSVDTGRDMQQPGPPSKLSRIVLTILLSEQLTRYELRHLPMVPIWQMKLTMVVHQTRVSRMSRRASSSSDDSSPSGSTSPTRKDKTAEDETAAECRPKGVILLSETFTEINAGLVIVLASGHESPVAYHCIGGLGY